MALGGGIFNSQNKTLPGAYINFVSLASTTDITSGTVAAPITGAWGPENEVFEVSADQFENEALKLFGYSYSDVALKDIREIFKHATRAYFVRMVKSGVKAANVYAKAKYSGTAGNKLSTVISVNVDDSTKFDVDTFMGTTKVGSQTVSKASELDSNDYVDFISIATLEATAGNPLTGGTDGDIITGAEHQNALNKLEAYIYNVLCCYSTDATVKALYAAFTKRMRDDYGLKFQLVAYKLAADHEGIINLCSAVTDTGANEASLVYWLSGAEASCSVNESLTNTLYDGEYTVNTDVKQYDLETDIESGQLVFHRVGSDARVIEDINSLVTTTDEKNSDFKQNQVIRVLDQIGNKIANIFNTKYLGKVQNDAAGRTSLWGDIVSYYKELLSDRAIEDFDSTNVTVAVGTTKRSVTVTSYVTPVCAMSQLYMTVKVQ